MVGKKERCYFCALSPLKRNVGIIRNANNGHADFVDLQATAMAKEPKARDTQFDIAISFIFFIFLPSP